MNESEVYSFDTLYFILISNGIKMNKKDVCQNLINIYQSMKKNNDIQGVFKRLNKELATTEDIDLTALLKIRDINRSNILKVYLDRFILSCDTSVGKTHRDNFSNIKSPLFSILFLFILYYLSKKSLGLTQLNIMGVTLPHGEQANRINDEAKKTAKSLGTVLFKTKLDESVFLEKHSVERYNELLQQIYIFSALAASYKIGLVDSEGSYQSDNNHFYATTGEKHKSENLLNKILLQHKENSAIIERVISRIPSIGSKYDFNRVIDDWLFKVKDQQGNKKALVTCHYAPSKNAYSLYRDYLKNDIPLKSLAENEEKTMRRAFERLITKGIVLLASTKSITGKTINTFFCEDLKLQEISSESKKQSAQFLNRYFVEHLYKDWCDLIEVNN
ncbi:MULTISPECIES: hypothetical protein [unclassified Pseudoalteromonas]|uniref:hypothetical protein n=1 Tax=unclassified Pseudoalteromonas TaxID=194690 RepID=UPI0005A91B8F|nr:MULTISPECIES: hypothetical protein [unclassified Pseudoalteromonas]